MLRIFLILAIVAGLAATVLNIVKIKEKITTLQADLAREKSEKQTAQDNERKAKQAQDKAEKQLKDTEAELATTKEDLSKTTARADAQEKQAITLADQLKKTKQERDDLQAEIAAWKFLGIPVDQIKATIAQRDQLIKNVAELEKKNQDLSVDLRKATNALALFKDPEYTPPLPSGLTGKVMVVDPKWDFVVLNVGQEQGVLEQGQMLVGRNGKLVGKVKIRSVEKDHSIANVMPGWQQAEVFEGDEVVVP